MTAAHSAGSVSMPNTSAGCTTSPMAMRTDRQNQQRQARTQLLGLQPLGEAHPVLRADHAAHTISGSARATSTLWFCMACSTVVKAVTHTIWKVEVPITMRVGMRSR